MAAEVRLERQLRRTSAKLSYVALTRMLEAFEWSTHYWTMSYSMRAGRPLVGHCHLVHYILSSLLSQGLSSLVSLALVPPEDAYISMFLIPLALEPPLALPPSPLRARRRRRRRRRQRQRRRRRQRGLPLRWPPRRCCGASFLLPVGPLSPSPAILHLSLRVSRGASGSR